MSSEDKNAQNGFSLKIVFKIDLKKKTLFSSFYYKVGKDKGSICYFAFCIFVSLGRILHHIVTVDIHVINFS